MTEPTAAPARRIGMGFDFETTGIPLWKEPSESPDQRHIVEVAGQLVDLDTRQVIDSFSAIVKPDDWTITEEMTAIHGISHEYAMEVGIPEADAIDMLVDMKAKATVRIAHNRTFDDRIARIALKRYRDDPAAAEGVAQPSDAWKDGDGYCTCYESRPLCKLPKNKLPTLQEAHLNLVGTELETSHRAMPDVVACLAVYFAIQDAKQAIAA